VVGREVRRARRHRGEARRLRVPVRGQEDLGDPPIAFFERYFEGPLVDHGRGILRAEGPLKFEWGRGQGSGTLAIAADRKVEVTAESAKQPLEFPKPLPAAIADGIREGVVVHCGYPEPILVLRDREALVYGFGDVFHFNKELVIRPNLILQKIGHRFRKDPGQGNEVTVTLALRRKGGAAETFDLSPGQSHTTKGLSIGAHRLEQNTGPGREGPGPQHWYAFELFGVGWESPQYHRPLAKIPPTAATEG
jgi:hypothetical protein